MYSIKILNMIESKVDHMQVLSYIYIYVGKSTIDIECARISWFN